MRAKAKTLMFQGTGSDVGKSVIVAGLCRALTNRGMRVRPFKPQNMSNNAAVTADGGEIGRAQALQARACRVAASVHMNPVLLKPQSDVGAQVVVQGKVTGNATARDFQSMKPGLLPGILDSFERLRAEADIVLVEGAGSAAEVNLRANDIANMGFARVGGRAGHTGRRHRSRRGHRADRRHMGGPRSADAALVAGFLVNKFRGDPSLFRPGMDFIADRTGWPGLGLIRYFRDAARLPAEDAVALDSWQTRSSGPFTIAVPRLAHIANFDDLDPLRLEPSVRVVMVEPGRALPGDADLVILPGSKATIADLEDFRRNGWDIDLRAHVRRGGRVLGICGGYQMLGLRVADPDGIEGPAGATPGLSLLDIETMLTRDKTLVEVSGILIADGEPFSGYEMHIGQTAGPDCDRPLLRFTDGRLDGADFGRRSRSRHVRAWAICRCRARASLLSWFGAKAGGFSFEAEIDRVLDALADHLALDIDLDHLLRLAR